MSEILSLAMPFFGLILLGVLAARLWHLGEEGLAWLNIFLVYFALPALIFLVVAAAPFGQLLNWPFMIAVTSVTICAFAAVTGLSMWLWGRRCGLQHSREHPAATAMSAIWDCLSLWHFSGQRRRCRRPWCFASIARRSS